MFAYFDLNERELLRLQKLAREGKLHGTGNGKGNDHKAEILLALANDEGYPHRGAVDFVGTKVSTSTGTMEVRANVPESQVAQRRSALHAGTLRKASPAAREALSGVAHTGRGPSGRIKIRSTCLCWTTKTWSVTAA